MRLLAVFMIHIIISCIRGTVAYYIKAIISKTPNNTTTQQKYKYKSYIYNIISKHAKHKEHIIKLPDTYVGDTDIQNDELYTLEKEGDIVRIVKKNIEYVPGLFKIYDEVIVNSIDHISRLLYISKNTSNEEKN